MGHHNPASVQLLGLCPLLAVSSTVTNVLDLVSLPWVCTSRLERVQSLCLETMCQKKCVTQYSRMIIASLVTFFCGSTLMNAYAYGLTSLLGIFIPPDRKSQLYHHWPSWSQRLKTKFCPLLKMVSAGPGMTSVLVCIGCDGAIGNGTPFDGADLFFSVIGFGITMNPGYSNLITAS